MWVNRGNHGDVHIHIYLLFIMYFTICHMSYIYIHIYIYIYAEALWYFAASLCLSLSLSFRPSVLTRCWLSPGRCFGLGAAPGRSFSDPGVLALERHLSSSLPQSACDSLNVCGLVARCRRHHGIQKAWQGDFSAGACWRKCR